MCGPDLMAPLVRHGAAGAGIAVVEGVMGLYDGASAGASWPRRRTWRSSCDAPVLLVVDARAMARSAAAVVLGFATYDPEVDLAGVILNRVGSEGHETLLREAIARSASRWSGRCGAATTSRRRSATSGSCRPLSARRRGGARCAGWPRRSPPGSTCRPSSGSPAPRARRGAGPGPRRPAARRRSRAPGSPSPAGRPSASTTGENLELLAAAGGELAEFDPLRDEALPEGAGALVLAGGFPETFAETLAENTALSAEIAAFARSGRPVVAECGGLLYLCRELDGRPMCGVIPAAARMTARLTLGYRQAAAPDGSACWRAGEEVRGHEFHYSRVEPAGPGAERPAWALRARGAECARGIRVRRRARELPARALGRVPGRREPAGGGRRTGWG